MNRPISSIDHQAELHPELTLTIASSSGVAPTPRPWRYLRYLRCVGPPHCRDGHRGAVGAPPRLGTLKKLSDLQGALKPWRYTVLRVIKPHDLEGLWHGVWVEVFGCILRVEVKA